MPYNSGRCSVLHSAPNHHFRKTIYDRIHTTHRITSEPCNEMEQALTSGSDLQYNKNSYSHINDLFLRKTYRGRSYYHIQSGYTFCDIFRSQLDDCNDLQKTPWQNMGTPDMCPPRHATNYRLTQRLRTGIAHNGGKRPPLHYDSMKINLNRLGTSAEAAIVWI